MSRKEKAFQAEAFCRYRRKSMEHAEKKRETIWETISKRRDSGQRTVSSRDMNAPYDVLDISRFIINHSVRAGKGISNLKLQKVLYLVQAYFLIKRGVPCFRERIEAWDFGPVVPEAYREFRSYGSTLIPFISSYIVFDRENIWNSRRVKTDEDIISERDRKTIAEVTDFLSGFSATALGDLTRSQLPWMNAYAPNERNEMTCEAIRSYFAEKAEMKAEKKENRKNGRT
jgi:uncharacterized phage-associated protein